MKRLIYLFSLILLSSTVLADVRMGPGPITLGVMGILLLAALIGLIALIIFMIKKRKR